MAENDFNIFVHNSIEKEVTLTSTHPALASKVKLFKSDPAAAFQDPLLKWKELNTYCVIIAPAAWLKRQLKVTEDVKKKVLLGTCRFVFWGLEPNVESPIPATFIPAKCEETVRAFLLNHTFRFPGWGLQTVLPPSAKILSERISNEKQIAKKIDQSVEFICQSNSKLKNRTLNLRLALTTGFSAVFSKEISAGAKPPTFQIGLSGEMIVYSLRWKSEKQDVKDWQTPEISWQAAFHSSTASVVQMSSETNEIEVIALLDGNDQLSVRVPRPLAIDLLTSNRLKAASGLPNETTTFAFEYFESSDTAEEKARFVTTQAPLENFVENAISVSDSSVVFQEKPAVAPQGLQMELTGLRVEHQKLEKQLRSTQEQLNETSRKMSQSIEAEKKSQAQINAQNSQIENLKATAAAQYMKEIESLKGRLESAKHKEGELVKKISQAIDVIKQLKATQKQAG